MIGKVLDGRYQIIQLLAKGGFGQTFLAQDTKRPGNPICVVKKLNSSVVDTGTKLQKKIRQLFTQEAEILQRLGESEHIPRLLAYFEEEREFYLVQEYIQGQTLEQELIPNHPLAEQEVLSMLGELLKILHFVQLNNVIHRDIKPANLIRREDDRKLVLIDFGAVKQITPNEAPQKTIVIGTPAYMPIEQLHGEPNYSSDIYAIGAICLQALTGIKPQPLVAGSPAVNFNSDIVEQKNIQVSQNLTKIINKMLCHDHQERYATAAEVLADLFPNSNRPALSAKYGTNRPSVKTNRIVSISLACSGIAVFVSAILGPQLRQNFVLKTHLPLNGLVVKGILSRQNNCDFVFEEIYCHKYVFSAKKDQEILIEMNSQDFDPYLVLQTSNGAKVAVNGDISPQNWNAQVSAKIPTNGKYIVIARSSSAEESGEFSITAKISP